jgi:hypothetical protein
MKFRNPFNKNKLYKLHIYEDENKKQSFLIQKRTWYNRYDNMFKYDENFFFANGLKIPENFFRENVFNDVKYIEYIIKQNITKIRDNTVQYIKIHKHEIINFDTIEELHEIVPELFI